MNKRDILSISLAVFIISNILLLLNIQKGEVQPWDEGLYAYRAREILNTNQWWEQTKVSLGGLYSSTYPPFVPWVMAINMKIFGTNLFSIRLFSVFCSSLTIFLFIYYFSKKFDLQITALIVLNLLLANHWFIYSRQGMVDIPLLFFIFSNLLATVEFLETDAKWKKILLGFAIAITFFLALMTKIILSLIPLLFLILLPKYYPKCKTKKIIIIYAIGFLLALPWYVHMSINYGYPFLSSLVPPHLFTVVEGNIKPLGILFYLNQLITSNPILIFAFFSVILRIKFISKNKTIFSGNFLSDVCFFWFILGIIIFSLAPTKLTHYTLYLLLPASYLTLEYIAKEINKEKYFTRFIYIMLFVIGLFWFFSPNLRQSIQTLNVDFHPILLTFFLITIVTITFIFFIERINNENFFFTTSSIVKLLYIVTIIILVRTIILEQSKPVGWVFGGEKIGNFLLNNKIDTIVYVFHKVNDSDTLNPQLAWYTNGLFSGKDKNKKIIFKPIPLGKIGLQEVKELAKYPGHHVVYYVYSDKINRKILAEIILEERTILKVTPNYIIFDKKVKKKRERKIIQI